MLNELRRTNATAAAQAYAPRPTGSAVTYGLVAAALMLAATFIAGAFFKIDVTSNLLALLALTLVGLAAGASFRIWRQGEYDRAILREYTKREPETTPPAPLPVDTPVAVQSVTFTSAFVLPGLSEPHPPGTFELRVRREPLDVSWAAFVETRTILLTGNGVVEALDVKADDLEHALQLDQSAPAQAAPPSTT